MRSRSLPSRLGTRILLHRSSSHHAVRSDPEAIPAVQHFPFPVLRPRYSAPPSPSHSTTEALPAFSIACGHAAPLAAHHAVISAFAESGDIPAAREVFDRMPQRNSVSYNSIISAYGRAGLSDEAWALLSALMSSGLRPTPFTFGALLSSPSLSLARGLLLHSLLLKTGLLHANPFSATALIGLYGRNCGPDDAMKLLEEMPVRTLVTWNTIMSVFAQLGLVADLMALFRDLLRGGIKPSEYTFLSILSGFSSSDVSQDMEQVHALVIKAAVDCFLLVSNALLNAYSNCLNVEVTERLFVELPVRDVVTWNTMIGALAKTGALKRALELLVPMSLEGLAPNETTLATVLGACATSSVMEYGELIHAKAIKHNLDASIFVSCSLVDFYAKCKNLNAAHRMFNEISKKNVVSWNALISGYSNEGSRLAITLLKEMFSSGLRPNEFSFSSGLKVASILDVGQLHSLITRTGYDANEFVSSALIASYTAHGLVLDGLACGMASISAVPVVPTNVIAGIYNREGRYQEAQELLSQLEDPDNVSWNILLAACARNGDYLKAFQLFKCMQIDGFLLDNYTAVSLLNICSRMNSLDLGALVHGLIVKTNSGHSEVFVNNTLVDMYAKCGNLESSLRIFEEMAQRNLVSWTALISGLGHHGCTHEALQRFQQLELEGFQPDRVTLLAVLSACRHGGLVDEGMLIFDCMMSVYGVEPDMDHYICIVDMLCRYGQLKEAERVISSMPYQPNPVIWRTFLQGCKRYGSMVN